jgi:dihydroorotase-like cyclic amidohydrolase
MTARSSRAEQWRAPADARVLDLSSYTILPGLIDAQVHLTIGGRPRDNADTQVTADLAAGAQLIKLCITNWPGPALQYPDSVELTDPELSTIAA